MTDENEKKQSEQLQSMAKFSVAPNLQKTIQKLQHYHPVLESLRQMRHRFPDVSQYRNITDSANSPFIKAISAQQEHLAQQYKSVFSAWPEVLVRQIKSLQSQIMPCLKTINDAYQYYSDRHPKAKEAITVLSSEAWFIPLSSSPIQTILQTASFCDPSETAARDAFMKDLILSGLDEIQETLFERHPTRKHLFEAAFSAHLRGEYILAIPVFLAQTDGIVEEHGLKLFSGGRVDQDLKLNKVMSARIAETCEDNFDELLLSGMAIDCLPHSANARQRKQGELNRHAIMHGESLDYGTESLSLKAISLLIHVSDVLHFGLHEKKSSDGEGNAAGLECD